MSFKNEFEYKISEEVLEEADINMRKFATAEDAYNGFSRRVDKEVIALTKRIAKHKKNFEKSDKKDWGYAGDLEHILESLESLIK